MSVEPWKGQRIGNLRDRITLQTWIEGGRDEFNNPLPPQLVETTIWARAEPIKGDEVLRASEINAYHEIVFHVRWRDDVSVQDSIGWRGATYNVRSTRNVDERRRYLAIECTGPSA